MAPRRLSFGFVLPYGEASDAFFPDTLLGQLCAEMLDRGHAAALVRVYYDGRDSAKDREVAARLERWLGEREVDVVVLERLFDPAPVVAHVGRASGRMSVLVSRGDSFDAIDGVDLVVGATPGLVKRGTTRRSPTIAEVCGAFVGLADALERGADPSTLPGVAAIHDGELARALPLAPAPAVRFRPVLAHDVICLGEPPRVVRKTLFGNAGCPFALDPAENPHFAGLELSPDIARLGCAFCCMGGDYQKRPDATVIAELVEQAVWIDAGAPEVDEYVLADQHPLRYLAALIDAARAAGLVRKRWLFPCRADAFLHERERIEAAVQSAMRAGHVLEVYLTGFESFTDRELVRYNKGTTVAGMLAAISEMRRLAAAHPGAFEYARAKGHSLVLWNPWTSPADVRETARHVRDGGLMELFHELGRNRLRLYRDLPIFYAAQRDGALEESRGSDDGAGRRKGYSSEQPWRFLDARTPLAYRLARALRDRLGAETEPAQLLAVSALVESGESDVERALAALDALEARLDALLRPRGPGSPERGSTARAAVVAFAGGCSNRCAACSNRDAFQADDPAALAARVVAARAGGLPIVLAGREPSIHPAFVELVSLARGGDGRAVGIVTNGRAFADAGLAKSAVAAGLGGASVKIFAPDAATADAISGAPGGFDEAVRGVEILQRLGVALEIRAPLHARTLSGYAAHADLALRLGVRALRVEGALDAIGLDRLDEAAHAVAALAARCIERRVSLEASPLSAGARHFDRIVLHPPR